MTEPLTRITEVPVECTSWYCDWAGIVADTEPHADGDGDLACPICGSIATEIKP